MTLNKEDLSVDGRLIRSEILKKEAGKAWIGLIRLRAWTGGGLL